MSGDQIVEFMRLYRQTSADHAFVAGTNVNPGLAEWLGNLVGICYGLFYRVTPRSFGQWLGDTAFSGAEVVRERWRPIALSAAITFGSAFLAAAMIKANPNALQMLVPAGFEGVFEHWKSGTHEGRTIHGSMMATAGYAGHNPMVGLVVNAMSAVTFGIMGVSILWTNGALLGALSSEVASVGHLDFLIISILPHGISELGGIFVTAASGFVLAGALLAPGNRTRGESLRVAGKDAFRLMIVGLIMIFIAAPIEGFFSFNPEVSEPTKIAFAAVELAAYLFFFLGWRRTKAA
jgi:uncharacterized membrane protein SpoIIM required for sporulation